MSRVALDGEGESKTIGRTGKETWRTPPQGNGPRGRLKAILLRGAETRVLTWLVRYLRLHQGWGEAVVVGVRSRIDTIARQAAKPRR